MDMICEATKSEAEARASIARSAWWAEGDRASHTSGPLPPSLAVKRATMAALRTEGSDAADQLDSALWAYANDGDREQAAKDMLRHLERCRVAVHRLLEL